MADSRSTEQMTWGDTTKQHFFGAIAKWGMSTWIIIGLCIVALILFIVILVFNSQKNELKTQLAAKTGTASSYRRRQRYMPDPGIAEKKMLYGTGSTMGNATAGYAPAATSGYKTGADPDKVLRDAIRQ